MKLRTLATALALLGFFLTSVLPSQAQVVFGSPTYVITAFNKSHITTDATTTLKTSGGILHTICINNPTATATITVYDNTAASGTIIAIITEVSTTQGCFTYDINYTVGLTIVTAVATSDITVSWY